MSERNLAEFPERVLSWEGQWVMLKYLTGPSLSGEDADEIALGTPLARSGVFFLAEVSTLGIFVGRQPHSEIEDLGSFIPWSSVLVLVGISEPETQQESEGEQT